MSRTLRVACGLAWLATLVVGAPLQAQESVFGGQERQFADHWSDWPNGYVSTTLADEGNPLIPIFEGWYPNEDGTFDLSFSYFNMNFEETFHIPIGPDNFLEPSQYNGMQPTFFMPAHPMVLRASAATIGTRRSSRSTFRPTSETRTWCGRSATRARP